MRSVLLLLAAAAAASADEIELRNGSVIRDCKVTDLGDAYKVVRKGITSTFKKEDVAAVEYKETSEDIYRKRSAALKPDDVEGLLALARWCRERKLDDFAADEFAKVIVLRPDHEEARLALGHTKHEGRWMTQDEANIAKGLVKHKGRWMTPAQRDLDVALDEQRELDRRIAAEVRRLFDRVATTDEKKRAEAIEAISAFEDRHKVKPCLNALGLSSRPLRHFAVTELGRMCDTLRDEAWPVTRALARRAIWDEVPEIRAEARRSIQLIAHPDAATALLPFLKEESATAHARAAEALGPLHDMRAFGPLLDMLERTTETLEFIESHRRDWARVVSGAIITRDGRRIRIPAHLRISTELFDPEGRLRLEDSQKHLSAAMATIAGRDHGLDVAAWRAWYEAKEKKPKPDPK